MTLTDPRRVGAIAIALAFVAQLFGNIVGNTDDEQGGRIFFAITLVLCALLAAWLFGRVVPRSVAEGAAAGARRALIVAIVAAVSFLAFWTGLPFVLAPAAIVMGAVSRSRGGDNRAVVAIVVGAIVLLASAGMVVGDELKLV